MCRAHAERPAPPWAEPVHLPASPPGCSSTSSHIRGLGRVHTGQCGSCSQPGGAEGGPSRNSLQLSRAAGSGATSTPGPGAPPASWGAPAAPWPAQLCPQHAPKGRCRGPGRGLRLGCRQRPLMFANPGLSGGRGPGCWPNNGWLKRGARAGGPALAPAAPPPPLAASPPPVPRGDPGPPPGSARRGGAQAGAQRGRVGRRTRAGAWGQKGEGCWGGRVLGEGGRV